MMSGGFSLSKLAVPAVSLLIIFLSYSSQYLFNQIEPGPLTQAQTIKFNILIACIWVCYAKACATDPGDILKGWKPPILDDAPQHSPDEKSATAVHLRQRWCWRCERYKPPRAHHCKSCQKCIPKMDHHCPWTNNCVSHFTYPHFIRFVFYCVVTMTYLEYFLYLRAYIVWENRNMPSYLGPSLLQFGHLFSLIIANSIVLFALSILLLRTTWLLLLNQTTIEGWEIERHNTLLRRARVFGGFLDGPDGIKVRIQKQEFPYDIGIWSNVQAGMGGSINVFGWFWPFSRSPSPGTGLDFEVNGFEDPGLSWPPPDPDRMYRRALPEKTDGITMYSPTPNFDQSEIEAFRHRQALDLQRQQPGMDLHRRKPFHERYVQNIEDGNLTDESESIKGFYSSESGEEGWRTSDGDRLRDFGVDEEVEFYDEDEIPLATLMKRRKNQKVDPS